MVRINKVEGEVSSPGTQNAAGGGDFMSRVNEAAGNIKELIKLAIELRKQELSGSPGEAPAGQKQLDTGKQKPASGVQEVFKLIVDLGYGDKPLGNIIEEISPFSVNQLVKLAGKQVKNAKSE